MNVLICDCESDGFLDTITRLWSIQLGSAEGDDVTVYADQPGYQPISEAIEKLRKADRVVLHNGAQFDFFAINRFYPDTLRPEQVYDTLVAVRLLDPEEKTNGLREWGIRLGIAKGTYEGDFQSFSPELVEYAAQDIRVTRALYNKVEPQLSTWGPCVATEMLFAVAMGLQVQNGFLLDVAAAQALDAELRGELAQEAAVLKGVFPPAWAPDGKPFTPARDDRRRGYAAGAPVQKIKLVEFNPGSRQQVAKRLVKLGWKPAKFDKNGSPNIDEDILTTLPYPEAKRLVRFFTIRKQIEQISEGKSAWLKWVRPTGRVHGAINTIGCASGRCSHSKPNMAQVNKKNHRMRAVWLARLGWVLVGCDAEGLQARILSHYLAKYDDGAFARRIYEGDKKSKTDVHSANLKELPFLNAAYDAEPGVFGKARDGAKTCLYCVLFGGGNGKLGRTLKEACRDAGLPTPRLRDATIGAQARKALFRAITGFKRLASEIAKRVSAPGWLRGIDGRHVPIRSERSALVFLMQAGEAAVMKLAMVRFMFGPEQRWRDHGTTFGLVANVHDEAQLEADPGVAEALGTAFAGCIEQAGVELGIRCPLAGQSKIGKNWDETH